MMPGVGRLQTTRLNHEGAVRFIFEFYGFREERGRGVGTRF